MICADCRAKHGMHKIKNHPNGRVEFLRCDLCGQAFFMSFPNKERKVLPSDYRDDWQDVNEVTERDLRFDRSKPYRL